MLKLSPTPSLWKNSLPWNQSLMPKMLGTDVLGNKYIIANLLLLQNYPNLFFNVICWLEPEEAIVWWKDHRQSHQGPKTRHLGCKKVHFQQWAHIFAHRSSELKVFPSLPKFFQEFFWEFASILRMWNPLALSTQTTSGYYRFKQDQRQHPVKGPPSTFTFPLTGDAFDSKPLYVKRLAKIKLILARESI